MPLNWHFVPGSYLDPETRDENGNILPKFGQLILLSERVGMCRINSKNVKAFARRVTTFERIMGYSWGDDKGPIPYTESDCMKMVGLRTNAKVMLKSEFDQWMAREEKMNLAHMEGRI